MAFEQKPNSGSLFKNKDKTEDTQPDYNGSFNIDGVEYWINAWVRDSKTGQKYFSLSVKPKAQGRKLPPAQHEVPRGMDNDLPF